MEVNEKIKWTPLLLSIGMSYIGIQKWSDYKHIKSIYDVVNSKESIPNKEDKKFVDKIRQDVISNINTSNLFNKFDKKYIIDSMRTIEIRIVDSIIPFSKNSLACYLYIEVGLNTYLTSQ